LYAGQPVLGLVLRVDNSSIDEFQESGLGVAVVLAQAWGSLYVLDLGETYKFLKNLSEYNGNSKSTFLEWERRV
jgi:hypothetical protein